MNTTPRLLPWDTSEGKPCYLIAGDGAGYVSRRADQIERAQLDMGAALLGHARALLDDPRTDAVQLRYLSARLTEALRDAVRVAESRGGQMACACGTERENEPE
ncbi:hypothetical protein [Streptomyces sp. NPDC003077]|uniref:hypothetical protein n=1 Tax=Streptomyces sp. NPDC003077 TaxID=3154443 RepID=UPI0033B69ED5